MAEQPAADQASRALLDASSQDLDEILRHFTDDAVFDSLWGAVPWGTFPKRVSPR